MSVPAFVLVCAPECASEESKRMRCNSNSNSELVVIVVAGSNSGAGSGSNSNSNSERDQHVGARLELQTCVAGCMKLVDFFMRWHEVAFVKWPGPLYAPPGSVNYYGVTLRWGQETRLALRHRNHIDKLESILAKVKQ